MRDEKLPRHSAGAHSDMADEERERARERLRMRQEAHRDETSERGRHERSNAAGHGHHEHAGAPERSRHAGSTERTARGRADAAAHKRHEGTAERNATHAHERTAPAADRALSKRTASPLETAYDAAASLWNGVRAHVPLSRPVLMGAAALLIVIAAVAAFQCSRPEEQPDPDTAVQAEVLAEPEYAPALVPFEPSAAALDGMPANEGLQTFSLTNADDGADGEQAAGEAPLVSDDETAAITAAIDAAEELGDVGIVFYNVETGKGIGYNVDAQVYGASSFKAPYALYVCETQIETGAMSLDDLCPSANAYDPSSYYNGGSYPLRDLMEAAIVYSDNNAYGALRDTFDFQGYDEWAQGLGMDDALYRADSWYPWYSARSSAKAWTELYLYLQTGTEAAQYLGELTGETETSFLRDALEHTGATVQDKAGWCADGDPHYNGVCDAGIVTDGDSAYIMSVMTGMPDGEEAYALFEKIAAAVFDARGALS